MKKALTIGLTGLALAASLSFVAAGSRELAPESIATADALPSYDILYALSAMGFSAIGQPVRRGPYYVVHAYDPRGKEVRVVADARFGDILSVARVPPLVSPSDAGPRIIHVPQPGEREDMSSDSGDEPADGIDDDEQAAPPPPPPARRRAAPKPRQRSEVAQPRRKFSVAPPPAPKRTVLSAPPPSADTGLTPIYPTPRFTTPAESGDKFAPPKDPAVAASAPPPAAAPLPPEQAKEPVAEPANPLVPAEAGTQALPK